jgi:hypothetical protein
MPQIWNGCNFASYLRLTSIIIKSNNGKKLSVALLHYADSLIRECNHEMQEEAYYIVPGI